MTRTHERRGFSLKEAAAIADVPEPAIRKAIAARAFTPRVRQVGQARRYDLRGRDLLYLALVDAFPLPLPPRDKRSLWRIIGDRHSQAGPWRRGVCGEVMREGPLTLRLDVQPLTRRLSERLQVFRAGRRRIVRDPAILSGQPVFAGTRIPLGHVAGQVRRGVPLSELREDYPALSEEDLAYAALVARMKPDPGRPRKGLQLVRAGRPRSDPSAPAHAPAH